MTATRTLHWENWPEADRALWTALVRRGELLDDAGALSHVRATTKETIQRRYARWLAWLAASAPEDLAEPPESRATPERLLAWMESMSGLAPASRAAFLDGPVRVLSLAAPGLDWNAQFRLRRVVDREAARSGSTRKVGRVKSTAVLLDAALELAGDRADAASTELEAAKRRRDGTMIAVLALMPIRRRAFAELELGRSVFVHPDRIDISLSSDMMKAGVPWEATVPAAITPLLRRYLDEVRSYFLARGSAQHSMLWTDSQGKPLKPGYLAHRIGQATQSVVGTWISPHLFRDAAATSLARLSPKDAQLVRPLLGHQSFALAERHYIQASMIEAGRDYGAVIDKLRSAEQ